jgi:hypothetical protein
LVLVAAVALALTLGSFAAQSIWGGGPAYASWTATPQPVSGGELEAVESPCRSWLGGDSIDLDAARLVLAERRGEFLILLYHADSPDVSGSCLVHNPVGSTEVDVVGAGVGGSSGPALKPPARSFTQGSIMQYSDDASLTDGAVGDAVIGVTIHAGPLTVAASVQNGRYAAWWPGRAFADLPPAPSGEGGSEEILTYDLTMADGTVVRDAQPNRPS